ncbi:MAG TPA: glycosyltransferase family 4 protein [Thermomicrobiaceae bacterium]|nr:glycosyltransferase family 4 protein [Thermomicrobiaceae bacterium]
MRIAQIAPLYERVPPKLYGGTERVVNVLTEELVRRGHDVTLFASGDSVTSARLEPMVDVAIRLGERGDAIALHLAALEEIYARADEFDLIHSHVDLLAFPFARTAATPTVSTTHGRLDFPEHRRVYARFTDQRLVSISRAQRAPLRDLPLRWLGTVHNGVCLERFPFRPTPDDPPYLVFLGRISPEKGPVEAVAVARALGLPLKVAAKIDGVDREWAATHFLPLVDGRTVEYLGEVDEPGKMALLGGALALLFPINWPEPFGMVLIEALACGTPVVAFPGGSVGEVLVDGVTGYVCDSIDDMAEAVSRIGRIDRAACRRHVEARFSAGAMADGYEAIYRRVLAEGVPSEFADRLLDDGPRPSRVPAGALVAEPRPRPIVPAPPVRPALGAGLG